MKVNSIAHCRNEISVFLTENKYYTIAFRLFAVDYTIKFSVCQYANANYRIFEIKTIIYAQYLIFDYERDLVN